MFKKSLIASAIATVAVLSSGTVVADGGEGFIDGSSMDLGVMYYGRERDHENAGNQIRVHALGLNANLKSGYYNGWLGADFSAASNIDLMGGSGHGQSEVLYYDNKNPGDERSSERVTKARIKMKFGDEALGADIKAGYTDINAGVIGTSAGINAHSYRGIDAKLNMDNLQLAYGRADQFQNDWDDRFRDLTNSWHQNKNNTGGEQIDFIHSIGARYDLNGNGWVDAAYGEGKDYRKNYHLAGSYSFDLEELGTLTLTSYYQSGKYEEGGAYTYDADPSDSGVDMQSVEKTEREYTWSNSAALSRGNWNFLTGYGQTSAKDSGEYQLRLTAWANSDHRNFLQTWAQLDDFLWDGQKVVKFATSYNFDGDLKGFSTGVSYNYGWDNYNNRGTATENRDGEMHALDFQFSYAVQSGPMEGLWLGVFPGFLRTTDTDVKDDRNDIKVMATYNISVF
ncbi:OprD family outer membrane porin [Endozoicomonas ascidiicola]|uniref:OprD family outer membrane porin n=1 Tax=Endozoicomonas ascidiicola TaxID=1698521 RepID=UPI0008348B09|nr:OprD family outer membrane porin [Endozoicomonas ascidiicola]